jgi:hypothetical protein
MPSAVAAPADTERLRVRYTPSGASLDLFNSYDPELIVSGPAGTGKSRGILEYLHLVAATVPGVRILMLRKTFASLKTSGLVTFDEKVRPQLDGVRFLGETAKRPPHYEYPNGSVINLGGLDRASKVLSSEYDLIYVQECTELSLLEWETLTTRLRNAVLWFQRLIGDCNPDAPTHWAMARAKAGMCRMTFSKHEDNPAVTPEYLATLDRLTGVRRLRLRDGLWAAAEGIIHDGWDRQLHIRPRAEVETYDRAARRAVLPGSWPRYLAIDFGFNNPLVVQWWAEDGDGRLWMYREIYRTGLLVEDAAREIRRLCEGEPFPRRIICDHDREDRATLERHLGWTTEAAYKDVRQGLQAVAVRLRPAGDKLPRILFLEDSLAHAPDAHLEALHKPCRTVDEVEGYVWDTRQGKAQGEEPLKQDDHGMDTARYMVAGVDCVTLDVQRGPDIWQ